MRTGTFSAVDVNTGKFLWKVDMPTPMIGGATVTASNLVFTGDQHGVLGFSHNQLNAVFAIPKGHHLVLRFVRFSTNPHP